MVSIWLWADYQSVTARQLAFIFSLYLGQKQILCDVALALLHSFQPHQPAFSASARQVVSRWDRPEWAGAWARWPLAWSRYWGRGAVVGFGAVQSGWKSSCSTERWLVSFREFCHRVRSVWDLVTENSQVIEIWRSTLARPSESGKALNWAPGLALSLLKTKAKEQQADFHKIHLLL